MFNPLHTRTLSIAGEALPTGVGGTPVLVPVRLSGTEALGKLYRYALDMETEDIPTLRVWQARELVVPEALIGTVVDISIDFDGSGTFVPGLTGDLGRANIGAGTRTISGIVTDVQLTGSDDRRAYYRLIVRPWLWLATKNKQNRAFQNVSVVELTDQVLTNAYPFPVEKRLGADGLKQGYPRRDFVRQMWESDFHFLTRVWREWGLYYFFDGLTLVLCDSPGAHKPHDNAYDTIRYHAPDGARIDEEHVHRLKLSRTLTSGKVSLVDYDYTRSRAQFTAAKSNYSKAAFDNAEHYRWGDYSQPLAGPMGLSGEPNDYQTEARYLASVHVDALRCRSLRVDGRGNLRGLTTGKTFFLEKHPQQKVNAEYLVISTTLDIRNVAQDTQPSGGGTSEGQYLCVTDFVLQPANTFFKNRPKKKPQCGPETAMVVGPADQPIWVDGYARIKICFVWDRVNAPNQNASCWVRVSSPWQGMSYGAIYIPRVGHEVVIGYHDNDPDRPYIAGRHVNQFNQPPWELPANQALSGWLSQDLSGKSVAANSVVTDDTPGKLQVQVASDQAQSRLVLGSNTRIDGHKGRAQARGEGFELATGGHGVGRANRGLLLTTESRNGAQAPAMDRGETALRLRQAVDQQDVLATAAVQAGAQESHDRLDVSQALKQQGTEIGDTGADGLGGPSKPHLVLASAAGVGVTATTDTHLHSGKHTALTSGGHTSLSAGGNLLAAAHKAIRLFAYQLGIRIISYAEDINISALKKNLNLLAKLDITQTANRITIKAVDELMLHGGDSYISLKNGKITVGGGVYEVNAQAKNLPPKPMGVSANGLPDVQMNDQLFRVLSPTGVPLAGIAYALQGASAAHIATTGTAGQSPLVNTEQPENVDFDLHLDEFSAASARPMIPAASNA